jgi:pimeloyl-ACP methyl ester carboxylesterase
MKRMVAAILLFLSAGLSLQASGQAAERAVEMPTRAGVTQRFLVVTPGMPAKAAVILFPGGDGGLEISQKGSIRYLNNNFLVRTRQLFADKGLLVVVVDAPSDRQRTALKGFRQTPEHVADVKAVIAWIRQQYKLQVWLVGTSRGTQSAAYVATELSPGAGGPDGLVLTSTILSDEKSRAVPEMPLGKISIPVLVVHHEQDGCKHCPFSETSGLMAKLTGTPRKELISFTGGESSGDPCQAMAHHGFNGLDREVVGKIADWITAK